MKIKNIYIKISERIEDFKGHPLTKNSVGVALYRYIMFNTIQKTHPKARVYKWIDNLKFYAQIGDAGIVANIYYKLFDYEDSMFLIHHLKKDDLFVDVGANVGHYSLLAAGICEAEVMAFEPIPSTFSKLNRNVNLNKLSNKIKLFNIGIGEESSYLNFTINKYVMNSVAQEYDKDIVRVEVMRLDDVLKDKTPVFLKIDVEGFEYYVLKGAPNVLAREDLKYIIIEFNFSSLKFGHTNEEIFELLTTNDFIPISYDSENKVINVVNTYNKDKFNTIFIRKNLVVNYND
jgi:FkbM family methyltransferase